MIERPHFSNGNSEPELSVTLGSLTLKSPVLTASGTFGYGEEIADLVDLSQLGAIIGKTLTRTPRAGNPPPRTWETPAGMLNAIGLQNVGLERFLQEKMPFLRECGAPFIANIAGETVEDFAYLCRTLNQIEGVAGIELNVSCPNVAHGLDFATDPYLTEDVVAHARKATELPLWAKLSPNVSDITTIARAAEVGGADGLSVCNTFVGMAVDIHRRRARLSNVTGGLSGPAIRPLALRAVYQCVRTVSIPVIGIGGITTAQDALEFLIAGASAVQVGTATFAQPNAAIHITQGIRDYLTEHNLKNLQTIIGSLQ